MKAGLDMKDIDADAVVCEEAKHEASDFEMTTTHIPPEISRSQKRC